MSTVLVEIRTEVWDKVKTLKLVMKKKRADEVIEEIITPKYEKALEVLMNGNNKEGKK